MSPALPPPALPAAALPAAAAGSLAVLRERLYRAGLAWFELPRTYYECAVGAEVVAADFPYLTSLARLILADARLIHSSSNARDLADAAKRAAGPGGGAPLPPPPPPHWRGELESVGAAASTSRGSMPRAPSAALHRLAIARSSLAGGATDPTAATFLSMSGGGGGGTPRADAGAGADGLYGGGSYGGGSYGGGTPLRARASSFLRSAEEVATYSRQYPPSLRGSLARTPAPAFGGVRSALSSRGAGGGAYSAYSASRARAPLVSASDVLEYSRAKWTAAVSPLRDLRAGSAGAGAGDMASLLSVCLAHEADALAAWHAAGGGEERSLPLERDLSFDTAAAQLAAAPPTAGGAALGAAAGLSAADWARLVGTAWAVSPRLAVALWHRFRRNADITAALAPLIAADAAAVRHLPEAVELLATRAAVAANAPALRQLLLWAPAPLPVVISLLCRCTHADAPGAPPPGAPLFAHPLVAAYVVRCLRRFSAEAVVFFLPQLVQALRHDVTGQLSDFLFATAQTSMLVAHQLLWTLISESHPAAAAAAHEPPPQPAEAGGQQPQPPQPPREDVVSYFSLEGMSGGGGGGTTAASAASATGAADEPSADSSSSGGGGGGGGGGGAARAGGGAYGFRGYLKGADPLPGKVTALAGRIVDTFPPTARALFELQYSFWDSVTNISGRLKTEVADKNQRRAKIKTFLRDLAHSAAHDAAQYERQQHRVIKRQLQEFNKAASGDAAAAAAVSPQAQAQGVSSPASPATALTTVPTPALDTSASSVPPSALPSVPPPTPSAAAAAVSGGGGGGGGGSVSAAPSSSAAAVSPSGGKAVPPSSSAAASQPGGGGAGAAPPPPPPPPSSQRKMKTSLAGAVRLFGASARAEAGSEAALGSGGEGSEEDADADAVSVRARGHGALDVVYMPTAPHLRVTGVEMESGRAMQSAAKCPFLLSFTVAPYDGPDATLREVEVREERMRRRQARMSSHARGAAMSRALLATKPEGAMARARVAAQHAALSVRKTYQRQRVQVGLSIERTRKQMAHGLSKGGKEVAHGMSSVVKSLGRRPKRHHSANHAAAGAGTATGGVDAARAAQRAASLQPSGRVGGEPDAAAFDERLAAAYADADDVRGGSSSGREEESGEGSVTSSSRGGGARAAAVRTTSAPAASPATAAAHRMPSSGGGAGGADVTAAEEQYALQAQAKAQRRAKRKTSRSKFFSLQGGGGGGGSAHKLPLYAAPSAGLGAGLPAHTAAAVSSSIMRTACIFKVYDDCRQDALVMQVVQLCKVIFDDAALGLLTYPYRVLPTRTGSRKIPGGILEVVPDVKSRDEIGKAGFTTLYDYFLATYGTPDGAEFETAQRNLIRSLAAYSIICYIMAVKDRHNGNLLITSTGSVIHIDFGFILGITPGGNLGFETAAFKLTQEFLNIMGGSTDTEAFNYFSELVTRAFLLLRTHADTIHALVAGMADSGLPCYHFPDTLQKLWRRFRPEDSDLKASKYMRAETLAAANRMTTILYDGIQKLQNNIHSETWQ